MECKPLGSMVNRKIGYGIVQPGQSVPNGIPVIKVNNIISGLKSRFDLETTAPDNEAKYSRTRLHGGELIISVVGTIGRTAIVPKSFAGCNLVRATALIDIDDELLTKWAKYYLDSPYGQSYIEQNLNTTVQPTLNIKSLVDMPIPIPDEITMKQIVSMLSSLDEKIQVNTAINDNLEQQARAVFQAWFIDYEPFGGAAPSDWHPSTLGQIAELKTNSWSPAKNPDVVVEHYSIPAFDEQHYPVFEIAAGIKSNKYILNSNSVMISKLNPDTKRIWRPLCLSAHSVCSTEFIVYEAKKQEQRDYIYSILDSTPFLNYLCSHTMGSTNSRQRATPKSTLDFTLCLPPDSVIEDFCQIVTPMYDLIASNIAENQSLAKTRDSLLPRLMSGELDVSAVQL